MWTSPYWIVADSEMYFHVAIKSIFCRKRFFAHIALVIFIVIVLMMSQIVLVMEQFTTFVAGNSWLENLKMSGYGNFFSVKIKSYLAMHRLMILKFSFAIEEFSAIINIANKFPFPQMNLLHMSFQMTFPGTILFQK